MSGSTEEEAEKIVNSIIKRELVLGGGGVPLA
jgi:hypothetical protein